MTKQHFRLKIMKVVGHLCEDGLSKRVLNLFPDEYMDLDMWSTIKEITPNFNDTFVFCQIFDKPEDCERLFNPIITESGLCYTFNALHVADMLTNE